MAFPVRRRPARLSSRLDPNSLPGPLRSRTTRSWTGSGSRARRGETGTPWGSAIKLTYLPGRAGAAELAHTRIAEDRGLDSTGLPHVDAKLATRPARQDGLVTGGKSARGIQSVNHACPTEFGVAGRFITGADGEGFARGALLQEWGLHLLEDVALNQSIGTFADIEGVTRVVEPEVVVDMPVAVELQLGGAAGGVVDVVSSKGHLVILAIAKTVFRWTVFVVSQLRPPTVVQIVQGQNCRTYTVQ